MNADDISSIEIPIVLARLDQVQKVSSRPVAEAVALSIIQALQERLAAPTEPWVAANMNRQALERVIELVKPSVDEVTLKTLELSLAQLKAKDGVQSK